MEILTYLWLLNPTYMSKVSYVILGPQHKALKYPMLFSPMSSYSHVTILYIGTSLLRPDDLPVVIHMHGMQYQIVINISFCPELNEYSSHTKH